jgi:acyl carrier protein
MMSYDVQETTTTVKKIIAEILKIDASTIVATSSFETLGADSLDMMQIIMKIEDVFGIEISDDMASSIKTVSEAVEAIQKLRTK